MRARGEMSVVKVVRVEGERALDSQRVEGEVIVLHGCEQEENFGMRKFVVAPWSCVF